MIAVQHLIWDAWNVAHIQRHEVTQKEVEEVCHSDHIVLDGHHGRLLVIGMTLKQRVLTVVLDPEPNAGVYYPVTAHPANRRDRRIYKAEKGGEQIDEAAA